MTPEELDADALWDAWTRARQEDPGMEPRVFVQRYAERARPVLEQLEAMLALEGELGPAPLVDVLVPADPSDTGSETSDTTTSTFAGFQLERILGQGGSGIVYLAVDRRPNGTGERVALKLLNPLLAAIPERRDSILREAALAGELAHEGIVRVVASGMERGYAWIATEYVDGVPLDRWIGEVDDPGEREGRAIEIGVDVARALGHAHAQGIVHRDLKPANVVLDASGRARVIDFGLARVDGSAFTMSRTGEIVGTPLYMAPEQARGEADVGPWTDVYGLGLLLLEAASGERLAAAANPADELGRIAAGRRRHGRLLKRITPNLRAVVSRCIEPHPDDRHRSAEEVEADLRDVLEGRRPRTGALGR